MAAKQPSRLNYQQLLSMIPVVMDFLDLDSDEIVSSGILDDDRLDDAAIAIILGHAKYQNKLSSNLTETSQSLNALNNVHAQPTHTSQTKSPHSKDQVNTFRSRFRMTEATFEALMQDVLKLTSFSKKQAPEETVADDSVSNQFPMSPSAMLMLSLRFLGSQEPSEQLAAESNVSEAVLSQVVHETMEALYDLLQYYILWPDAGQVAESCDQFQNRHGLQGVLGSIDALHIQVKAPAEHTDYYTNQRKETTVVLQTVCDHRLRFLHCCTGWPGSMDERTVLTDSDLHHDVKEQTDMYFPFHTYLLGDEAYPLTSWLLTPFAEPPSLSAAEKKFNSACEQILKNNMRAHSLLLKRFPRLERVEMRDMQSMVVTILVCCALHNFCLDRGDVSSFDDAEVTVRNFNTVADCEESAESVAERKKGRRRRSDVLRFL